MPLSPPLERSPTPSWLETLTSEDIGKETTPLPLRDILAESLYYPACGVDGLPIEFLGGLIHSFVYVDYGVTREAFAEAIGRPRGLSPFAGYSKLGERWLQKVDLAPDDWGPERLPRRSDGRLERLEEARQKAAPYAHWSVWQRNPARATSYGPTRFSLLQICGDGVATYQALYRRLEIVPKVLAIIQPGTGFGGNWTDFRDEDGFFARVVAPQAHLLPEYLLYGGWGDGYDSPCWSAYSEHICRISKTYPRPLGAPFSAKDPRTRASLWRRPV